MGGQTNTLPITNEPHSANSISDITHPSATVITTLRLPKASGGYTLTIHSDAHHIRVAAIDSVACSGRSALVLRTLPPLSLAPPRADNTAPARAARNPAFALETASVTPRLEPDFGAFMHLLYALWTVKTDQEAVRLVVPEHVAELSVEILRRGAGIKSPFVPLSGDIHELLLLREAFWQGAMAPQFLQVEPNAIFPMSYTMSVTALRHPVRAPKPMPGTVFYERWIPHLSEMISFRVVDPSSTADVTIFNRWQNDPRVAVNWQETGTMDEHRVYLQNQTDDPHSMPVFVLFDNEPAVYLEFYWAAEDRLASYLTPALPYDRGYHALVGNDKYRGAHRTAAWVPSACHYCFLDDPRTQRIVVEPKLTNTAIVSVAQKFAGMTITKWFDFPHKRSALLEVSRERFFQLMPLPSKAQEAERQVAKL